MNGLMTMREDRQDTSRTVTLTLEDLDALVASIAKLHGRLEVQAETMRDNRIPSVQFWGGGMHHRGLKILNAFCGSLTKAVDMRNGLPM